LLLESLQNLFHLSLLIGLVADYTIGTQTAAITG